MFQRNVKRSLGRSWAFVPPFLILLAKDHPFYRLRKPCHLLSSLLAKDIRMLSSSSVQGAAAAAEAVRAKLMKAVNE